MLRKLPVYLLLDTSESMVGKPISQLRDGVEFMLKELKRNPYALETAWLSIITFSDKAVMASPLTELKDLKLPNLSVRPGTSLGAALKMAKDSIDKDVTRNSPSQKGDFKPLIFILTDGEPTDEWRKPLVYLTDINPVPLIICVGCGDDVDFDVLTTISASSIRISDLNTDALAKFFVWLSSSIGAHSQAVSSDRAVDLLKRPLPQGIELVKSGEIRRGSNKKPRIFIHARCRKTKEPYIMVYKFDEFSGEYHASESHPLPPDFFTGGSASQPKLDSDQLNGSAPCPYCGSPIWYSCGNCENIACWDADDPAKRLVCPSCGESGGRPVVSAFEVKGSEG
jgi:uncharacterized protein YegL/DNA-directed RNA polymerase subunit RPC12/RpoP